MSICSGFPLVWFVIEHDIERAQLKAQKRFEFVGIV